MRSILTYGGTAFLVCLVLVAAAALLPACGAGGRIAWTWSEICPVDTRRIADTEIAALTDANRALEQRILQREREVARLQCAPEAPVEVARPQPPLPEKIDPQDWSNRRIALLEGCWALDSRFSTTNRQTGEPSRYDVWTMCFDGSGQGREEMRADNGNTCSGPVEGRFDAGGALVIEEPGNLQCSDGSFIYRLSSRCALNDDGTASCAVAQPETGRTTTVEFRRSAREE